MKCDSKGGGGGCDGGEGYDLRRHSGNSELVGLTSAPAVSVETTVKIAVVYRCEILVILPTAL